MIIKGAFTKGIPFNKNWRDHYMTTERKENWFYRLLIFLKLRKPHRLFNLDLQKIFEEARVTKTADFDKGISSTTVEDDFYGGGNHD